MTPAEIIIWGYLLGGVGILLANTPRHRRNIEKAIATKPDSIPAPIGAVMLLVAILILAAIDVLFWPVVFIPKGP